MDAAGFFPGYYEGITDSQSKKRYKEKLEVVKLDPYEVKRADWEDDVELWPAVTHVHVCMYLILTPSPYTDKDMLNYKSLDCYQNFTKGWVRNVLVKKVDDKRVMIGKVNHSQRLNDKPLTPWVIAMNDGQILSGHCDCMAGMGETCSHVASLLWVIASGVQQRDSFTVTDKSAYWVMPSAIKSVPYSEVRDISFAGKKRKQHQYHIPPPKQDASGVDRDCPPVKRKKVQPSEDEKASFLMSLASLSNCKPVVLSVLPDFCDRFIPTSLAHDLPLVMSDLYDRSNLQLCYYDLLKKAQITTITVTPEQAKAVELNTRQQSNSRLWFRMRAGRITASKFKAVCHTDPASPSLSLIMCVCHPESFRFTTKATAWGCQHEKSAISEYVDQNCHLHECLTVKPAGFFISVQHPFLGASPDGIVECKCCGWGILEAKVS